MACRPGAFSGGNPPGRPSRFLTFGAGRVFVLAMDLKNEHSQNEVEGLTKPMPSPTPRVCD